MHERWQPFILESVCYFGWFRLPIHFPPPKIFLWQHTTFLMKKILNLDIEMEWIRRVYKIEERREVEYWNLICSGFEWKHSRFSTWNVFSQTSTWARSDVFVHTIFQLHSNFLFENRNFVHSNEQTTSSLHPQPNIFEWQNEIPSARAKSKFI